MTAALPPGLQQRLQRKRRAARLLLLFERLWPALWPPLGVLGAFVCASLLALPQRLPPEWHIALLAVVAAAIAILAWRGLRRLSLPGPAAGDRWLEAQSGLRHRPLEALTDQPARGSGDPLLWQAHVARLAASVGRLRLGLPRPGLAARDPRAWRALLLLVLVVSLVVAGPDAPARLLAAVAPTLPPAVPPPAPRLQAWITPPAYTGMAPMLLTAEHPDVSAPEGSRLTVTLSGGQGGAPVLSLAGHDIRFQPLDAASWQAGTTLSSGGTLLVRRGGGELGRWEMTALADVPPSIQWTADPTPTRGRMPQLRLPWQVAHPYGVAELHAELRLQQRPQAPPLRVPIPLAGAPRSAKGLRLADLTAHPWAGLPVTIMLAGHDTGGLAGQSGSRSLVLPERVFLNPAARVLIAVRKMLVLRPEDRGSPLVALDRLAQDDALWQADSGAYLVLREIMNLLARTPLQGPAADKAIDSAQTDLWQLALHLEEGAPARTARALAQARRNLHEAMRAVPQKPPAAADRNQARQDQHMTPAEKAEIARREQALREAMQQYMQALRREAEADPRHPAPPEQQAMQAEQALRRLRQSTQEGRMDEAQQRLAELDRALDALEQARRQAMQTPEQRAREAQRRRGQQQMGVLDDIIRREAGILDHAQARSTPPDQMQHNPLEFPPGQTLDLNPPMPQAPVPQPGDEAERHADRRVQDALRRALGVLMQNFGDLTGQVPRNLGDADQRMRDALHALDASRDDKAATAAQRAIAALQKGGQAMQQQLAQQFGRGSRSGQGEEQGMGAGQDDQGQGGEQAGRQRTDPFGRPLQDGVGGLTEGGDTKVPETMERARTRAVQEELRRREADRNRPQRELDYIGRLLDTQ